MTLLELFWFGPRVAPDPNARRLHQSRGETHTQAKLTDAQISEIRKCWRRGETTNLARQYKVSQTLIRMIVQRRHR